MTEEIDKVVEEFFGQENDLATEHAITMAEEIVRLRKEVADLRYRLSWANVDQRHEMGS